MTLYVVRNRKTGEFFKAGSKAAWLSSGAAKNAWCCSNYDYRKTGHNKFSDQNDWEVREVFLR